MMTVMAMLMEVMKMNNDAKGGTLVVGADRVVRGICRASFLQSLVWHPWTGWSGVKVRSTDTCTTCTLACKTRYLLLVLNNFLRHQYKVMSDDLRPLICT